MRARNLLATVLIAITWWLGTTVQVAGQVTNVRQFGAVGDDEADDTQAFNKAVQAGRNVYVPAGIYRIRSITLPDETYLHGDGRASVIRFVHEKTGNIAVHLGSHCRVSNLSFTASEPFIDWMQTHGSQTTAILGAHRKNRIQIDNVEIHDYRHMGVYIAEGCEHVRITNCTFERLDQAIQIEFAKRIQVMGNVIREIPHHGIQFWGNLNFTDMVCEDLMFANNYIFHGGSGAIWGTGARRVTMIGNIVDGAKDIGLDLEWCYDATITGNVTRDCWNAGIALFLSCKNVAITGNTVVITKGEEGRRDGIWLTGVNRSLYKNDFGHRHISITGNTVVAEGRLRHGISIGSGADIVCAANSLRNSDLLDRTGKVVVLDAAGAVRTQLAEALAVTTTVIPLRQEWRFATDPEDRGLTEQWFDPQWDDSQWDKIRSDTVGAGWEAQGYADEEGKGYAGYAWYRAQLPELPADKRKHAYLHFGLADEQAWVYLPVA